jgi:hypothetical protein
VSAIPPAGGAGGMIVNLAGQKAFDAEKWFRNIRCSRAPFRTGGRFDLSTRNIWEESGKRLRSFPLGFFIASSDLPRTRSESLRRERITSDLVLCES